MRTTLLPIAVLIVLTLTPLPAMATACPGVYAGDACNPHGATPICVVDAAGDVACNINANYSVPTAETTLTYFVTPTSGGTEFLAYGTDIKGDEFCCQLTMATAGSQCERALIVDGTGVVDTIHLDDPTQGWNMTYTYSTVNGNDYPDYIYGSNATNNCDWLNGDSEGDTIFGGQGRDTINGGSGNDFIYGGAGADEIDGGSSVAWIKGGTQDDIIYGGSGADLVCGDDGVDDIYGEDGGDQLYGGAGADTITGGPDSDNCEAGAGTVCDSTTLASCPW